MGRLIQFPLHRLRRRGCVAAGVFGAFGELETLERGQLKLLTGCVSVALLLGLALQLVAG